MREDSPHDLLVWPSRYQTVAEMLARKAGSKHGLPLDRPLLVWRGPRYTPRKQWSPSSLGTAFGNALGDTGCLRQYWFRYMLGIKEYAFPWNVADALEQPPKKNTEAGKLLTRTYNKRMGSALGKQVHHILEGYYKRRKGFERELRGTRPGRIALTGLGLLPHPRDCAEVYIEQPLKIDQRELQLGGTKPAHLLGFKDLVAVSHEHELLLGDYKTTGDKRWVKTPRELLLDDQANAYGLDVMQRFDLDVVEGLWIYFLTKGKPWADGVPFQLTRKHAIRHVSGMVKKADKLRSLMVVGDVEGFTPNAAHCPAFGGCPYSKELGGPCDYKPSTRERYRTLCGPNARSRNRTNTTKVGAQNNGIRERSREPKGGQRGNQGRGGRGSAPPSRTPPRFGERGDSAGRGQACEGSFKRGAGR